MISFFSLSSTLKIKKSKSLPFKIAERTLILSWAFRSYSSYYQEKMTWILLWGDFKYGINLREQETPNDCGRVNGHHQCAAKDQKLEENASFFNGGPLRKDLSNKNNTKQNNPTFFTCGLKDGWASWAKHALIHSNFSFGFPYVNWSASLKKIELERRKT